MRSNNHIVSRNELIAEIALDADVSLQTATKILDSLQNRIVKHVVKHECVQFRGFGTYEMTHYSARDGVNPNTGKAWHIAPHDVVHFKPSKTLTTRVNQLIIVSDAKV